MWIATLAIAGVPLFAGFFSKDEILGTVFERAQGSTLSDASWLGIPGSALLYAVYGICLVGGAPHRDLHDASHAVHVPRPEPDRAMPSGQHLHEAPAVMTLPLVVLGVLSAVGGLLNVPVVPSDRRRWTCSAVARARRRARRRCRSPAASPAEADPHQSAVLAAIATAVALARASSVAVVRLKPAALVRRASRSPPRPASRSCWSTSTTSMKRTIGRSSADRGLLAQRAVARRRWPDRRPRQSARRSSRGGSAAPAPRCRPARSGTYAWALVIGVVLAARRCRSPGPDRCVIFCCRSDYDRWILPVLLIVPVLAAADRLGGRCCAWSRRRKRRAATAARFARWVALLALPRSSSCCRVGLWWSLRSHRRPAGSAPRVGAVDSDLGCALHARDRWHRARADPADDACSCR